MRVIREPGSISGSMVAPPSKSHAQRLLAGALLHRGRTVINNMGGSDDEIAALRVVQQLGARVISRGDTRIEIVSNGVDPVSDVISCGESGLAARLFAPIAATCGKPVTIEGSGSLLRRPMEGVGSVLSVLSVDVQNFNGYLPFAVKGALQAKSIKMDASGGSQFLSGLLFALSSCAKEPITVEVAGLKSRPYIDMTLDVLRRFGKPIAHQGYRQFYINPSLFTHEDLVEADVEGDWSGAAFFLVAGAIAGEVTVTNLRETTVQADKVVIDILKNAGAHVVADDKGITVRQSRLSAFDFDATHCPDLFPVLAIMASFCDGESSIAGVHRLFHKESNRVESVTEMLHDFAVPWSVEDDTLFVTGVNRLHGTVIDSFKDHRIVMAAAIGASRASGPVEISFAESVNKSYPGFFDDLKMCGARCNFNNDL